MGKRKTADSTEANSDSSFVKAEIVEAGSSSLPWWGILLLTIAAVVPVVLVPGLGILVVPAGPCVLLSIKRVCAAGWFLAIGAGTLLATAGYANYLEGDLMLGAMFLFYIVASGIVYSIAAAVMLRHVARKNRPKRLSSSLGAGIALLLPVLWFTTVEPVTTRLNRERVSHPTSLSDFPLELRNLVEYAKQKGIDIEPLRVFCVSRDWYEEYYWQTKASSELLQWSTEHWRLLPLERESENLQHFWERMPAEWHVSQATEAEFYISTDWLYTEYGTILMHDKANGRFYFWYMNDF